MKSKVIVILGSFMCTSSECWYKQQSMDLHEENLWLLESDEELWIRFPLMLVDIFKTCTIVSPCLSVWNVESQFLAWRAWLLLTAFWTAVCSWAATPWSFLVPVSRLIALVFGMDWSCHIHSHGLTWPSFHTWGYSLRTKYRCTRCSKSVLNCGERFWVICAHKQSFPRKVVLAACLTTLCCSFQLDGSDTWCFFLEDLVVTSLLITLGLPGQPHSSRTARWQVWVWAQLAVFPFALAPILGFCPSWNWKLYSFPRAAIVKCPK